MGYERQDRRYGEDRSRPSRDDGRDFSARADRGRDDRPSSDRYNRDSRDYGRPPQGYDDQDRGFLDRAGDEVRSWFGDEEAERRRDHDARHDDRDGRRNEAYGRDENYAERARRAGGGGYPGVGGGYSGDFGAGRGAGATGTFGLGAGNDREQWAADPNYRSWREQQLAQLDRDYQEYHQENQRRFSDEFGSWRQTRQTQRASLTQVQEHQEVVGSDGQHVGIVDKVRGDRIILTKGDKDAGDHHHSIPSAWIASVDDKVTISKTADQAKQHWRDEERNSGDFLNRDRGNSGARSNPNRSFSGTY